VEAGGEGTIYRTASIREEVTHHDEYDHLTD
jgi:hypothetical protein